MTMQADRNLTTDEPGTSPARSALDRSVARLRALQHPEGWWKGELETNVTIEAEDLLVRQFLGIRTDRETEWTARWIRSKQRGDGSWATFHGGPADLSTTVEAYLALRLAGDRPEDAHLVRARDVVRALGGLEQSRVFTRIWLALFGLWPWDRLPAVPVEQVLLPAWVPLSVHDFACWARQTIVPIAVLCALRPHAALGFDITELYAAEPAPTRPSRGSGAGSAPYRRLTMERGRALLGQVLDVGLRVFERHHPGSLRSRALRRAEAWIIERQEADGSWGGIQPPWVYSLMALRTLGRPLDDPVMQLGLGGWSRFTVEEPTPDGPVRRIEACQSPVWDTALALVALGDAGLRHDDPAVARAVDWVLREEITTRGDWAVRRPHLAAGGWAFEFDNDLYPDVDDTAEVVLGLDRVGAGGTAPAVRGTDWVLGMQCRDGGWAAFDAENTSTLPLALPFCDFGAVTDPPSADVTAHVVELLGLTGRAASPAARAGRDWLLRAQEPDGSWFGRWGANHVYGTGAALPALVAVGVEPQEPAVRRGAAWLEQVQNVDGGWGEDLRSYRDPSQRGRGTSTASQTAWALLGLLAAEESGSDAVRRGVQWLVEHQQPDGGWDEPHYTGTGFPGDFYINYHLYRLVFPVSALARYVRSLS
ncbi:squalene-hopene cyclase [Intrasporangium chromatireducens Q5-1]|uniref:Squalene-hopene cyclase n=1 Tax=Intrasporangium chromatireducens Q5-1 TaxID=584657 RepID=W9GNN8_9MICO|nr:squalene--hopene cyclase [Intrasporangium chromatireducens]EWT07891.1 squalene-hopene cyclase [Intrasporangium chromatireducens Q5-1]